MDHTASQDSPVIIQGSYWEAFQTQSRIVGKILVRESYVRYQKNPIGFGWAFVEPCLHIAMWWVLLTYVKNAADQMGMPLILILCSGFVPLFLFRGVAIYTYRCVRSAPAVIKYELVSHVDVIIAKFILESIVMTIVGFLVFSALIIARIAPLPRDPLALFLPCLSLLWLGLGFGTLFAFLAPLSNLFRVLFVVVMRTVYFTSGIFFLGNKLPTGFLAFILWNPIFHAVELFREAYFYNFYNPFVTVWYPFALGSVLLMCGLLLERKIFRRRRLKRIYR